MAEPNDEKAVPTDVAAVAAEVESFLRAELPSDWVAAIDAGDAAALRAARGRLDEAQWWRRLGESGYIAPTWPQEYGGLGANRATAIAVSRTLSPGTELFTRTDRSRSRWSGDHAMGYWAAEARAAATDREPRARVVPAVL
jgi:hypothetical protein